MTQNTVDPEARALAQCYALLIRKAQERRARLARDAAAYEKAETGDEVTTDEAETKNAPK